VVGCPPTGSERDDFGSDGIPGDHQIARSTIVRNTGSIRGEIVFTRWGDRGWTRAAFKTPRTYREINRPQWICACIGRLEGEAADPTGVPGGVARATDGREPA
jgi:hypothetical protein